MPEKIEPSAQFTIVVMTPNDVEESTQMRLQSWRDTYINDAAGVTLEWVEAHIAEQLDPAKIEVRKQLLRDNVRPSAWVAKDNSGKIIGQTTPYIDEEGRQHVGSLYVNKQWHGKGVGAKLMQQVIEWANPAKPLQLDLVSYNDRARKFYEKWGFEVVPGLNRYFKEVLPEVLMVRPGDAKL